MPELTISTTTPLTANIHVGPTTIEPFVTIQGDDIATVELGGPEVAARLIGHRDVLAAMLADALAMLAR